MIRSYWDLVPYVFILLLIFLGAGLYDVELHEALAGGLGVLSAQAVSLRVINRERAKHR